MVATQSNPSSRSRMSVDGSPVELPAREVHQRLRLALTELQRAERNAVLWFAEMVRRKLYKELGYSSIHQYAELELGFCMSKTSQFLRLSESLVRLPGLRRALAREEIPWTKAREVATVATPRTEAERIQEAKKVPRRVLEKRVKETRRSARAGSPGCVQPSLEMGPGGTVTATVPENNGDMLYTAAPALSPGKVTTTSDPGRGSKEAGEVGIDPATPVSVQLRMTAEQHARYQALMETLRKQKAVNDQVEMVLAGLEQMALERTGASTRFRGASRRRDADPLWRGGREAGPAPAKQRGQNRPADGSTERGSRSGPGHPRERELGAPNFPRGKSKYTRSPYQVIVQKCPSCSKGTVPTTRGEKVLSPRELRTILCDARIRANGIRNTAPIPERLLRAVMERDRYQCRAAGCGLTIFLAVHHLVPREANGANAMENLITLCSGCHRALHDHA